MTGRRSGMGDGARRLRAHDRHAVVIGNTVFRVALIGVALVWQCAPAVADTVGPLTFSSDSDYDNANPPANPAPNGLFRDFVDGNHISRGPDLGNNAVQYE